MRSKIKGLSGVDILTDTGAYKSTYQIIKEIAYVWEDMNDMDRAALLELMAGKNRSNIMAALLTNLQDLEGAYEDAMTAEGSAMRENEAYLNSIQGRVDLFTNAVQTFWMNFIDTDAIKGVVDFGTTLIKILDTLPGKIAAVVAGFAVYKRFTTEGLTFAKMFDYIGNGAKTASSAITPLIQSISSLNGITLKRALSATISDRAVKKQIISEAGLATVSGKLTKQQIEATIATLAKAKADGALTTAQYLAAMSAMGLKTAIQGLFTVLMQNPIYLAAAAVTTLALAFDKINITAQESADKTKEAFDEIKSIVESTESTIQSLKSELQTIQDRIDELNDKKLSFAEEEELEKLQAQSAELEHSLEVQNNLLKAQKKSQATQAVTAMKAYTKAASQGAEETQKTAKLWGTIIGVIGGVALTASTGGLALLAAGAAGGIAGNKLTEWASGKATENDGTYDSWYGTYTKALETARKEEEKALIAYEKDSSNIKKLDKWREAQQEVSDIETEMYDNMAQMQQYYNTLEYGIDPDIDKELDAWNNFLDKFSISEKVSGAEVTALDRIFGENATDEIQSIKKQIEDAIRTGKEFDFSSAISQSEELSSTLKYVGLEAEDVKNYFTQLGESGALERVPESFKSYSALSSEVEAYNTLLTQTSEYVADNVKISQEYKDSLTSLVDDQKALNECFYEGNPLVVKNAKALNELVNAARNNVEANIDLAQSQSRLDYYELIQELGNICDVTEDLTSTEIERADSIMNQIDLVQQQIYKYQLLKETLSETGQAYTDFKTAQEIDALNTTGSNFVEMAQTVYDAFYVNGQVGTQAFDAAVEALIPDEVYASLESDGDKLVAIYDYFNKKVLPSLTLDKSSDDSDEGTLSIDNIDVENFVEKGLNQGIFTGSANDGLAAQIGMSYEEAAKKIGMTVNQFKAYLAELEKYDYNTSTESFLSQFDQSFDGEVSHVTSKMQELNEEKFRLLSEDGGYENNKERIKEINKELGSCGDELDKLQSEAVESYEKFANNQHAIEGLETIEDKTRLLTKEEANLLGIEWDEVQGKTVQEAIDILTEKKLKLGEPTQLQIQFAQQGVINEIDDLIAQIEKDKQINIGVKYNTDTGEYEVDSNSEYASIDAKTGAIKIEGLGEQGEALEKSLGTFDSISSWLDDGLVTTETLLSDIKNILNSFYEEQTGKRAPSADKTEDKFVETQASKRDFANSNLFFSRSDSSELVQELQELSRLQLEYDQMADKESENAIRKYDQIKAKEKEIAQIRIDGWTKSINEIDSINDKDKEIAIQAVTKYGNDGDINDLLTDLEAIENEEIQARIIMKLTESGEFNSLLSDLEQNERTIVIKALTEGTGDVDQLNGAISQLPEDVQTQVYTLVDDAMANVKLIDGKLQAIDSTSADANVSVSVEGLSLLERAKKLIDKLRGVNDVNGTTHAHGTAHAGGNWGAPRTETALTGELGRELIVRGDRWFTVGDNGAEFANIQKGDIIFNHKQTEELLKNGHITSRGKLKGGSAHAQGTAYAMWSVDEKAPGLSSSEYRVTKKGKSSKNSKDEFEEVFDWFEVRLEEINEDLDLMAAKLENAITITGKNNILDSMIKTNKEQLTTLEKGYALYNGYAKDLLKEIPKAYRDEAKNGKIAIEEFYGKVDEGTLEAIKNYREWAQKAADLKVQLQETKRTITELAKQKFDNIIEKYDNIEALQTNREQHYTDMADYLEDKGEIISGAYYEAAMAEVKNQIESNLNELNKLQASLDESVRNGDIKKYSPEWYDMVNAIHEADAALDENKAKLEEYQNTINEIEFENFEKGLYRITRIADETQNLIDIMADKDVIKTPELEGGWGADDVEWTAEGITQLGLYAQKMENYKKQSELYAEAIEDVNQMYHVGKISEQEYLEKLDELKDGQYDAIKGYEDSKDAIVDLQKARVDAIKEGIEKEIEAYEELIEKKKEELSAEKDLYDFQQNVMDQSKDIATIQRKLAALAGDNSSSAIAKRKQLEAELVEAQSKLDKEYYDRSVENRQDALDEELESFKEAKEVEQELWDKYIENTEQVFKDAMQTVENSGATIKNTIEDVAKEWDLQINTHIKAPWKDATSALQSTASELDNVITKFNDAVASANKLAQSQIAAQKAQNGDYTSAEPDSTPAGTTAATFKKGEQVLAKKGVVAYNADGTKDFTVGYNSKYTVVSVDKDGMVKVQKTNGDFRYFKASDLSLYNGEPLGNQSNTQTETNPYGKTSSLSDSVGYGFTTQGKPVSSVQWVLVQEGYLSESDIDGKFGPKTEAAVKKLQKALGVTVDGVVGPDTKKALKNLKGYAKGSTGIDKDQLAIIDELGEELQLVPGKNGRLAYITKGTAIIPSDISENLMTLGQLDPTDILNRNRPEIAPSPSVINNTTEINLDASIGTLLHVDKINGSNPEEIIKIVDKAWEKKMEGLNNSIRRFAK